MMRALLHWIGVALDAAHLVLAATLAFIPEAREPAAADALRALLFVNGARLMWMLYSSRSFGMTPARMVRARSRPRVSLLMTAAMLVSAWAVTVT